MGPFDWNTCGGFSGWSVIAAPWLEHRGVWVGLFYQLGEFGLFGCDVGTFAGAIGRFVSAHPTIKMLALSFLFVVGVALVAEGFDKGVPNGYIYFAIAFSVVVEMLNLRARKRGAQPVHLHQPYVDESSKPGK